MTNLSFRGQNVQTIVNNSLCHSHSTAFYDPDRIFTVEILKSKNVSILKSFDASKFAAALYKVKDLLFKGQFPAADE